MCFVGIPPGFYLGLVQLAEGHLGGALFTELFRFMCLQVCLSETYPASGCQSVDASVAILIELTNDLESEQREMYARCHQR